MNGLDIDLLPVSVLKRVNPQITITCAKYESSFKAGFVFTHIFIVIQSPLPPSLPHTVLSDS